MVGVGVGIVERVASVLLCVLLFLVVVRVVCLLLFVVVVVIRVGGVDIGCDRREKEGEGGPPGLHTTTQELQTCTFDGPWPSNTKIPRKEPQEREERMNTVAGEGKKARNFGPLHPSGAQLFQVRGPTLWVPTLLEPHLMTTKTITTTIKILIAMISTIKLARVELAKVEQNTKHFFLATKR